MAAKRQIVYAALAVIAISGIITIIVFSFLNKEAPPKAASNPSALKVAARSQNTKIAHLYFADKNNLFLISEERVLHQTEDPIHFSRNIIAALIKGSAQKLARTIPEGAILRAVYITEEGICFVDLSASIQENHPGGVDTEMLTIYSIVNSLILNIPEIQSVKILIEGQESMTLAGHIDLHEPLKANMLLIR